MLVHVYLLALLGFSTSLEIEKIMPSQHEIESSINRTIEEVEKLIQENPSLPKLGRTDIVNVIYNITSKDMSSIEDKTFEALQKLRTNYRRALMVVLPHKLKNSESLKDLFAKPPVVQIFDNEKDDEKFKKDSIIEKKSIYKSNHYSVNNNNAQQIGNLFENEHQLTSANLKDENNKKPKTPTKLNFQNIQEAINKANIELQQFNFNSALVDQKAEASHTSIATKRPLYKGTFSRYRTSTQTPLKSIIIYSSTTINTPISKPDTIVQNKSIANILSSDQWHYYAPPTISTSTRRPSSVLNSITWKLMPSANNSVSISTKNSFIDMSPSTTPTSIFVTPSVASNQEKKQSVIKTDSPISKIWTSTVKAIPMTEEVELLLKSIGLQPIKQTNHQTSLKTIKNTIENPLSFYSNGKGENSKKAEMTTSNLLNTLKNTSFQIPSLLIKNNVKNLSPDIQLLFQQFGLQMPVQKDISTTTTSKPLPTISINSFTHFKPLPTSSVRDKDFRNFLSKFGLGIGENRNDKAMQSKETIKRPSIIEAIPDNMKKILENIGLLKKNQKIESNLKQDTQTQMSVLKFVDHITLPSEHIFKPYENTVDDKEQNKKIKNLLNTIRMVQEGTANVQTVQDVANDLLKNTKPLENGLDPIKLEEILNNYKNSLKNEVKRHQDPPFQKIITSTSTSTMVQTSESTLDETTLSLMATTGTSDSSLDLMESKDDLKKEQTNHSPSLSKNENTTKKPNSFFDNFDITSYLNNGTEIQNINSPPSPESSSTPGHFDILDINDHLNRTTEEDLVKNANVNLSDLEDSFGGTTVEPYPVIPTRPKTGLYFLVDWNTFLEVGEEGKEKVNLRFSPKVGDRTRFISVKMP